MKRAWAEIAAAGTASTILFTGCTTPKIEQGDWIGPSQSAPAGTPEPEAVSKPTPAPEAPKGKTIMFQRPELPYAVGRLSKSVVEIVGPYAARDYYDTNGTSLGRRIWDQVGSGVVVMHKGARIVLTADHVVTDALNGCGSAIIKYQPVGGLTKQESKVALQSEGVTSKGHEIDASVLLPAEPIPDGFPPLDVQPKVKLTVGDPVFTLGYGPRNDVDRNPHAEQRLEREPVINTGIVIGINKDTGAISYLNGIFDGYGYKPDNQTRPGDSGGPFVDADGGFIGVHKGGFSDVLGVDVEKDYSVDLPEGTETQTFKVSVAHAVTEGTMEKLVNQASGAGECAAIGLTRTEVPVGTDIEAELPPENTTE